MIEYYKILDIYHTGYHGPRGSRKIGRKYNERRGYKFEIDSEDFRPDYCLFFKVSNGHNLLTTPYVSRDESHIETKNSIYEVKSITYEEYIDGEME